MAGFLGYDLCESGLCGVFARISGLSLRHQNSCSKQAGQIVWLNPEEVRRATM